MEIPKVPVCEILWEDKKACVEETPAKTQEVSFSGMFNLPLW